MKASTTTILLSIAALVVASCGGSANSSAGTTTTVAVASTTTTVVVASTSQPTTSTTILVTTTAALPSLDTSGDDIVVRWANLSSNPHFSFVDGVDPHYLIHTDPATDGFFLSFEMYTTGYGAEWTGELGTFDISCDNPTSSTGICPYFDPDGPGPSEVLGSDFATTGSVTINALDGEGYDIVVHDLVFSDGTSFSEFSLTG